MESTINLRSRKTQTQLSCMYSQITHLIIHMTAVKVKVVEASLSHRLPRVGRHQMVITSSTLELDFKKAVNINRNQRVKAEEVRFTITFIIITPILTRIFIITMNLRWTLISSGTLTRAQLSNPKGPRS